MTFGLLCILTVFSATKNMLFTCYSLFLISSSSFCKHKILCADFDCAEVTADKLLINPLEVNRKGKSLNLNSLPVK